MAEAYICDYIRTPIGRFGGSLSSVRADDLGAIPLKALIERNPGIDWQAVDDVVFGCANQAGEDNRNVARMSLLLAGLPKEVSGSTVNRLCGSGMDAVTIAARAIKAGEAELMIAGGVESMSRAPFVMPKADDRLFAQCRDLRHHHRLALRQPADEEAVRRRFHAGDRRERRRGFLSVARRPGCLCRAQPGQGRRRAGQWPAGEGDHPGDHPAAQGRSRSSSRRTSIRAPAPRSRRWPSCRRRSARAAR